MQIYATYLLIQITAWHHEVKNIFIELCMPRYSQTAFDNHIHLL